jgi:hypothetical protein
VARKWSGFATAKTCRRDRNNTYLLRTVGNEGHEILDVTDPANPKKLTTLLSGQTSTHKSWWECDTGIAYIVTWRKADGWRSRGMKIYDLSDPTQPRFIRDYGLVGQEPGSKGEPAPQPLHGPIRVATVFTWVTAPPSAELYKLSIEINSSRETPLRQIRLRRRPKIFFTRSWRASISIRTPARIQHFPF